MRTSAVGPVKMTQAVGRSVGIEIKDGAGGDVRVAVGESVGASVSAIDCKAVGLDVCVTIRETVGANEEEPIGHGEGAPVAGGGL